MFRIGTCGIGCVKLFGHIYIYICIVCVSQSYSSTSQLYSSIAFGSCVILYVFIFISLMVFFWFVFNSLSFQCVCKIKYKNNKINSFMIFKNISLHFIFFFFFFVFFPRLICSPFVGFWRNYSCATTKRNFQKKSKKKSIPNVHFDNSMWFAMGDNVLMKILRIGSMHNWWNACDADIQ